MSELTTVHLLRHGEVHNPGGVLYGRLPGFRLSETGEAMAVAAAEWFVGHDVTHLVSSPLERAQQTARPLAEATGLAVAIDDRLIEAGNAFEGMVVGGPGGVFRAPRNWWKLRNPFQPSWGEPYVEIAARMIAAVEAARRADRLLAVDLSYRGTRALQALRDQVQGGGLGRVFAMDLVFHNAYGPDKPWFYDKAQSGGGPLMDLGVHLIDSALWCLDFPRIDRIAGRIYREGSPTVPEDQVEDYASASLTTDSGIAINIACSWRLHAGTEAKIEMHVHGTGGGASLTNPGGGFYDFAAHRHDGTATRELVGPPDDWGGRMAQAWARQLAVDPRFEPQAERLVDLARVIDGIYGQARAGQS